MKTLKIFILSIILLIFSGCKLESEKAQPKKPTVSKKEIAQIKIPENVDNDFKVFLHYFSKDSIFQISRIHFPLKVIELDDNNTLESIEKTIQKKEYTKLDFDYPKDALTRQFDKYTQKIKTEKDKTVIEIRGFDNDIYADYFFEKENGKWFLKSWRDTTN